SRRAVAEATPKPQWFVVDAIPMDRIDISGVNALQQLNQFLESEGIRLVLAGRRSEFIQGLKAMGMDSPTLEQKLFPTLHQAVRAFRMTPGQPGM
ncbi:SulP family inorganic anion transporter, partial [Pseudomonas sp. HMWF031]